jgi:hypothetical protein
MVSRDNLSSQGKCQENRSNLPLWDRNLKIQNDIHDCTNVHQKTPCPMVRENPELRTIQMSTHRSLQRAEIPSFISAMVLPRVYAGSLVPNAV